MQSVFHPNSPDAAAIAELMWVLVIGAGAIFVLTMALLGLALRSRPAWLTRERTVIVGGIVVPALVVLALLAYTLRVAAVLNTATPELRIEVTGHQWWWQIRYLRPDGTLDFETANEIRLPVGRHAEIVLVSADVLHSFWVPNLGGKLDLVPGRVNRMRLSAQQPGMFRGQCAEYCGGPHAQMALFVVAQPENEFARWLARQRAPAAAAHTTFMSRCAVCHAIRGTAARGNLGPDLTHVGSRLSIGAGALPNNATALADWIGASQHVKPGNLMPSFAMLDAEELHGLAGYLASLE